MRRPLGHLAKIMAQFTSCSSNLSMTMFVWSSLSCVEIDEFYKDNVVGKVKGNEVSRGMREECAFYIEPKGQFRVLLLESGQGWRLCIVNLYCVHLIIFLIRVVAWSFNFGQVHPQGPPLSSCRIKCHSQ